MHLVPLRISTVIAAAVGSTELVIFVTLASCRILGQCYARLSSLYFAVDTTATGNQLSTSLQVPPVCGRVVLHHSVLDQMSYTLGGLFRVLALLEYHLELHTVVGFVGLQ